MFDYPPSMDIDSNNFEGFGTKARETLTLASLLDIEVQTLTIEGDLEMAAAVEAHRIALEEEAAIQYIEAQFDDDCDEDWDFRGFEVCGCKACNFS